MNNFIKFTHDHKMLKHKSEQISEFTCRVKQLHENEPPLDIKVSHENSGQWLLDEVCELLGGIQEKDYFGLRYSDKDKQRQWIDLSRNVYSQLKDTPSFMVSFRMKHYPAAPIEDLKQDLACYFLYLQLRKDLYSGRLLGRSSDLYQLAAYAVQSENGDYDAQNEYTRSLSNIKLLPNLNSKTEAKITDIHKNLGGLTPTEVEQKFLEKASQLDTYGVEPFYVKDQKGNNLYVGLTHEGVSTFQGSRRAHLFKWADIAKIHYQGKLFIIHVFLDEIFNNQQSKKKHVLGFKCETSVAASALWKWANDRMCFFSLNRSSEAKRVKSGGGIFKKRQTFKFAGRCQKEIQQSTSSLYMNNPSLNGYINNSDSACLNNTYSINKIGRRNTILRDAVQVEDLDEENKAKYNTMPSRERGKFGTQDTLDSLFIPNHHGSVDNAASHSPINTPVDSPKLIERKYTESQRNPSLGHIIEEPCIQDQKENSRLVAEDRKSINSITSSRASSSRTIYDTVDGSNLQSKLSNSHGDIANALEQLQIAVTDAVDQRVAKRSRVYFFLTQFLCLGCLLTIGLLLIIMIIILIMVLGLHYRTDSGLYDYSKFLTDIVTNPREAVHLISSEHLSKVARNSYSSFYQYIMSSSNTNNTNITNNTDL